MKCISSKYRYMARGSIAKTQHLRSVQISEPNIKLHRNKSFMDMIVIFWFTYLFGAFLFTNFILFFRTHYKFQKIFALFIDLLQFSDPWKLISDSYFLIWIAFLRAFFINKFEIFSGALKLWISETFLRKNLHSLRYTPNGNPAQKMTDSVYMPQNEFVVRSVSHWL